MISVIISTYNRPEAIERCLESIRACIPVERSDTEIVVVDDGSKGAVVEQNRTLCTRLGALFVPVSDNRGVAAGRNRGVRNSKGEWLVFIDDDVLVSRNWYDSLATAINSAASSVVGFEGAVSPSGKGLWDKEVANETGGGYLTCNIAYRRSIFEKVNGFDEIFKYAEDHELASRMLRWGNIVFLQECKVIHQPREMKYLPYIQGSFKKMHFLLRAEFYFYSKSPEHYFNFRASRTFWGTYLSTLFFHSWSELRRRTVRECVLRPWQCMVLLISSVLEQFQAWRMLYYFAFCSKMPGAGLFHDRVDFVRTAALWQSDKRIDSLLQLRQRVVRSVFFPVFRKPVYDIRPALTSITPVTSLPRIRFFLRIDDCFYESMDSIERLCHHLKRRGVAFLAGVKGDDLVCSTRRKIAELLLDSGAEIALHGFTHAGRYGPYQSEILQMKYTELDSRICGILESVHQIPIPGFIAPFNSIGREQILFWANTSTLSVGDRKRPDLLIE